MEGKTAYSVDKTVVAPPFIKKTEALEFTDPQIPGEIKVDQAGKLLKTFFQYEGIIGSLIDEENNRITLKLPEQIASRSIELESGEVTFENVMMYRPRISTGTNTWIPLLPQMARESGYTYSSEIYVDLVLNKGQQNEEILPNVYIGNQPVMLGSLLDNLSQMSQQQKIESGESIYDPFGYFIIKGSEKVVLIQEQLRSNKMLVFNASSKGDVVCKVTNNILTGSTNISILQGKKSGALKIHLGFMGKRKPNSKIGNSMSIFQIYRMLGISDPDEIAKHIYKFTKPEYRKRMFVALQPSYIKLSKVGDDIEYISKKKGIGDIDYDMKKATIMNDLINQLFPQIPAENIEDKLNMLSIMTVRLLEYLIGVRELDDRDNWGNKQLVSAGKSLERLFSSIWRELIKIIQNEVSTKNLHGLEAVKRLLKPSFITENFVNSFTANNWGVKSSYLPKENITDFLKRDSNLSVLSHLTKINIPISRQTQSSKIRLIDMSQLGYVSPSETPEGENCIKLSTPVLLADGTWKKIENVDTDTVITTVNSKDYSQEKSKIIKPFKYNTKDRGKILYKLTTVNGRVIEATGNHPFLTLRGWVNLEDLKDDDLLCVRPSLLPMSHEVEEEIILSEQQFGEKLRNENVTEKVIKLHTNKLKKLGLLPLKSTNSKLHIISRIFGFTLADGSINIYNEHPSVSGSFGTKRDGQDYLDDLERLGFDVVKMRYCEGTIIDKDTGRVTVHKCYKIQKGGAFPSLLIGLNISFGRKTANDRKPIPNWIMSGSKLVKREFISGFQGGDGNALNATKRKDKRKAYNFGLTEVIQRIDKKHVMSLFNFMKQIVVILDELEVKCTNVEYRQDKTCDLMICAYRISRAEDNLIRYMDNVGYRYAFTKNSKGIRITEYLKYKSLKINERQELKKNVISMYNCGLSMPEIAKDLDVKYRTVSSIVEYYNINPNSKSLANPKNLFTIDEFISMNPMEKDEFIFLKISNKEEVEADIVVDFTTVSDNHSFIANGFVTHNCGLNKNTALTTYISIERPESVVLEHISQYLNKVKTEQTPNPLMLNGVFRGWVDGVGLRDFCIGLRRKLILFKDTLILLGRDNFLLINTDSSRPTRPLLVVDTDGVLVIEKKELWSSDMETLLRSGCVEYIDAEEQQFIMLAQTMDEVSHRKQDLETAVRTSQSLTNKIVLLQEQIEGVSAGRELGVLRRTLMDTQTMKSQADITIKEMMKLTPFTHAELDPSAIESIAVSIIPLPETNPGPRITYQAGMGKQALGIYHSNHPSRFETTAKVLSYPSRPLFETQMNEVLGLNELPAGEMVILAISTYGGFSQEDAIIMSQGAIDRGLFRYTVYKKYDSIQKRTRATVEEFTRPASKPGEKDERYHAIDDNGLPRLGSFVREGDCVIGKVRKYFESGKVENASKYIEIKQEGIVDKVLVSTNQEGNRVVKVKIRQVRTPIMGDKFACYTPDHEVLTLEGWKNINELSLSDKIYSLNAETNTIDFETPTELQSYDFDGDLCTFKNDNVDLKVTPNHRMFYRTNKTYKINQASNIINEHKFFVNKDKEFVVTKQDSSYSEYNGKVYCCTVPSGIIYVRRNGKPVWCGNSRYAQKGTIGLILPDEDMPYTADGVRPDIILNPHAIPSRMTIGKLIEIVTSKAAAFEGERINATAFRRFDVKEFMRNLTEVGYSSSGKERMYSGYTGKPLSAMIFTGPCYYQSLRHHVSDKIQMRARGGIKQLTHQPVGGRKRGGGQRVGEMERDAIISHGAAAFLQERLCLVSDAYETVYCSTCGNIAIADHIENKYICRTCEDEAEFGTCTIPYSYKLLSQLLAGAHYSLTFGFKKNTE